MKKKVFFDVLPCYFRHKKQRIKQMVLNKIALIIAIIGTLNWGLVGLFSFDAVAWICGGAGTVLARIIYTIVALAGIWCISLLFQSGNEEKMESNA